MRLTSLGAGGVKVHLPKRASENELAAARHFNGLDGHELAMIDPAIGSTYLELAAWDMCQRPVGV